MPTTFKGNQIRREDVLRALELFNNYYPSTNDYENWLENDAYIYAILLNERRYPPKHILSETSGILADEFSGGEMTNRVFRQLGFEVGYK
jgi:hypothetical protein